MLYIYDKSFEPPRKKKSLLKLKPFMFVLVNQGSDLNRIIYL